mgnify:CR=1 FL=1
MALQEASSVGTTDFVTMDFIRCIDEKMALRVRRRLKFLQVSLPSGIRGAGSLQMGNIS